MAQTQQVSKGNSSGGKPPVSQATLSGSPKAEVQTKPVKKTRRVKAEHEGTSSKYTMLDGSGTITIDRNKLPSAILDKLVCSGLTRTLVNGDPSFADIEKHILKLMEGVWTERVSKPRLPDPLIQAMVNINKRNGQGTLSAEKYAKAISPEFWSKFFGFDLEEASDALKAKRAEFRANDEVQAEIRTIKAARKPSKIDMAAVL